jgi:hypothetical protein
MCIAWYSCRTKRYLWSAVALWNQMPWRSGNTLQIRILKVRSSDLGCDTNYSNSGFRGFLGSFTQMSEPCPQLHHSCLLSDPSQFIYRPIMGRYKTLLQTQPTTTLKRRVSSTQRQHYLNKKYVAVGLSTAFSRCSHVHQIQVPAEYIRILKVLYYRAHHTLNIGNRKENDATRLNLRQQSYTWVSFAIPQISGWHPGVIFSMPDVILCSNSVYMSNCSINFAYTNPPIQNETKRR